MEEIRTDESLQAALDAAVPLIMDALHQANPSRENWVETLKALEIPEELVRKLPKYPEHMTEKEKMIHEACLKLILVGKGIEIQAHDLEWKAMYYRSGLADGIIHTREETGERFGVSRKRIQAVEEKFIRRIRQYIFRRHRSLREFYI